YRTDAGALGLRREGEEDPLANARRVRIGGDRAAARDPLWCTSGHRRSPHSRTGNEKTLALLRFSSPQWPRSDPFGSAEGDAKHVERVVPQTGGTGSGSRARGPRARGDRSPLHEPRWLGSVDLLLREARFYGAAGGPAHARAARRERRPRGLVQRVLEGL